MTCNNKVETPQNPRRVTYCPLPSGHTGKCIPDGVAGAGAVIKRCSSVSPSGIRCGMPVHPIGIKCQNGMLCNPWTYRARERNRSCD